LSFDITKADPDMPSITIALIQSFYVMQYEIARSRMKGADIIISPETGHIATWEFYRAKEIIDIGYRTAKESLSKPR
ncbi:MAG: hypothetical protein JW928_07375, partial [Candidatus Aureabacteria bacterium]|nr:hypothetical protein [Candidatus Auribacterota bacterium]